jgi:hypothetical protein
MWHGPVKCCSHHQPLLLAGQGPSPSIGDVLLGAQVSFHWYGEGWSQYAANPSDPTMSTATFAIHSSTGRRS